MSTTPASSPEPTDPATVKGAGLNGWLAFATIILFLSGCFGALYGLTAILNDDVITIGGGQGVVIWSFTAWGWITLVIGVLMVATSIGLVIGRESARWLAVAFATLNALAQFALVTAFPLWSILIIVLDVVIIYQLVVRWEVPLK